MQYLSDCRIKSYNYVPVCEAWIDRVFEYCAMNFVSKGYIHCIDENGKSTRLDAPMAFWTATGNRYRYGCNDGVPWEHRFITFEGPRTERYIKSGLLPAHSSCYWKKITAPHQFERDFDDLLSYLDTTPHSENRAILMLESLLLRIHEQPDEPGNIDLQRIEHIRTLAGRIKKDPSRQWRIKDEAKNISVSESHFRLLFRKVTGISMRDLKIQSRLNKAAIMLRGTNASVKKIAIESGMEDVYYFSKVFKKYYGMSPTGYRRNYNP